VCLGCEERRKVDADAANAIDLCQADEELALPARDVDHLRVIRETEELDHTRQLLFACGVAHDMFAVRDVEELPVVHGHSLDDKDTMLALRQVLRRVTVSAAQ